MLLWRLSVSSHALAPRLGVDAHAPAILQVVDLQLVAGRVDGPEEFEFRGVEDQADAVRRAEGQFNADLQIFVIVNPLLDKALCAALVRPDHEAVDIVVNVFGHVAVDFELALAGHDLVADEVPGQDAPA